MHNLDPLSFLAPVLPSYDVVIPCYNRAHVVADAVESVLAQDHPPERVLVVDDGSTDRSAHAASALADLHPQVTAITLPRNGGASNARNAGAALSRAPWLAFLDSDDMWLPGAARALLLGAARSGADVVVGQFSRVEAGSQPGPSECGWNGDDIRCSLATGGVVGPSWSMVRRQALFRVGGFDPSFHNCNDWDFFVRVAASGATFARIDETVALYRTVAGTRLVADTDFLCSNGARVLAHPYLAALLRDEDDLIDA